MKHGVNLGIRETFDDVGATVSYFLGVEKPEIGRSFLAEVGK